jgi:hypothetical protein
LADGYENLLSPVQVRLLTAENSKRTDNSLSFGRSIAMPSMKVLRLAALAVVLGAIYAGYVAPAQEKVATLSVTPPAVAIAVENVRVAPTPMIDQGEIGAPTPMQLVTGDGQQADLQSNASLCSDQPLACAP